MPNALVPAAAPGLPKFPLNAKALAQRPKITTTIDPTLFDETYALICDGDCMEPEIADGSKLIFDPAAKGLMNAVVAIWRKPGTFREGEHQVLVKRLLYRTTPEGNLSTPWGHGAVVEMINPRKQLFFPHDHIVAVHKMVRILPKGFRTRFVSDEESNAAGSLKKLEPVHV